MSAFAGCDKELHAWLTKLLGYDVTQEGADVHRVIIDIPVNNVVSVYVHRFVDKDILSDPMPQALLSATVIDSETKEKDNEQD